MDFKTAVSAFAAVFLAELGDKTQLAILSLAADSKTLLSVFVGASLAMISATLLAVVLGGAIGAVVPERVIRVLAGSAFVVIGALMLFGKL